ncbi:hypothetical protein [Azospirillum sp. sgz302134]
MYSYAHYTSVAMFSMLLFSFGIGVQRRDSDLAIAAMISAGVTAVAVSLFRWSRIEDYWQISIILPIVSFNLGMGFSIYNEKRDFSRFSLRIIDISKGLLRKRPVQFVLAAFVASIIATLVFSFMVDWASQVGFWYGFYQSWTAGFAAFLMFGLAGIAVSLHRPGEDNFQQRVANLFNVTDLASIDYLCQAVQKVGYYSVSVERTYKIVEYDKSRKAYRVIIHSVTKAKNFLHDVSVPDRHHVWDAAG